MKFENDGDRRRFGRAAVVGIELAIAVVGGLAGGYWLDQRLDTEPTLTLVGMVFGSFTGFYILWKLVKTDDEEADGDK